MANLQAVGFDGETIIYLLADGTGTDLDPFISKFALTDDTVTAIENILPEFVFDGDRLLVNANVTLPDTYPVSGTVSVDNFPASQPVTGDFYPEIQPVSLSSFPAGTISTLTNVASSASSVTLITANNNRKALIIVNDSTATLYLRFGTDPASTTNYSFVLPPIINGIPSVLSFNGSDYSGEVRGVWSSANGFARITEVV